MSKKNSRTLSFVTMQTTCEVWAKQFLYTRVVCTHARKDPLSDHLTTSATSAHCVEPPLPRTRRPTPARSVALFFLIHIIIY